MFLNRTIANTAISPNAFTRLLDKTDMTIATSIGITTSELTNDLEYESPLCVYMYTQANVCPHKKASNRPIVIRDKSDGEEPRFPLINQSLIVSYFSDLIRWWSVSPYFASIHFRFTLFSTLQRPCSNKDNSFQSRKSWKLVSPCSLLSFDLVRAPFFAHFRFRNMFVT